MQTYIISMLVFYVGVSLYCTYLAVVRLGRVSP